MKAKFIVYAVLVALICTVLSWYRLLGPTRHYPHGGGGGSSWSSSSSSSSGGGSWSGGGHK